MVCVTEHRMRDLCEHKVECVKDFVRVAFQNLYACIDVLWLSFLTLFSESICLHRCSLVVFSDPLTESYLMSLVIVNEKSQTTLLTG